ncbi:MAG: hypothetical protein IJG08_03485 [Oscillospiraceae bacterium]|nr:hypothetical protein [Oscillospiraceae bacterium]
MEKMQRSESRKRTRLRAYDYSGSGVYFMTVCTEAKRPVLCRIVGAGVLDGPRPELTAQGKIVQNRLEEMERIYDDISIDHYVIMPNHVHLLLTIRGAGPGTWGTPSPTDAGAGPGTSRTPSPTDAGAGPGTSRTPSPTDAGARPGTSRTPSPTNARLPQFLSTFKRFTNREIGFPIWQRSYHDHIIRDEPDFLNHWQYIDDNPAKWAEDPYYCD